MLALRQLGAAYPEPTKTVWVRRPSLLELNGAYISKRVKNSKHADMLREYAKNATTLILRQKIGHLSVQGQSSGVEKKQI